ncbi:phosphatidylglycerol:prolipoprotein diacylglycerol transferase [Novosphingobium hassiacum]|uniref:Phosphatidylglycerol--prolipoprotein diacylglyceryl transferase n=1 Tax=Novosphingobium hassiacum TaxID=173676 RepID=A0A7W5ZXZ4_9SPHN|nr:prolipoprotein diacylglyceryl transferase [Novosphingobium hassiacum]MBB3862075.1 phosphatidylglycerol:prolipoprotein diacylglycerol transferase [Novosphingobium hassiacum]
MSLVQGAQHGIAFTSLGLDPVLLQMGPFALRWYSMAYLAGIVLGWLYLIRLSQDEDSPLGRSDADELITWATVGIIAGGRLAYVLFYEPAAYLANPLSIFTLWRGGMSFHGGAFGVGLAIFLYCRSRKLSWIRVLDYVAMCAPIGLMLGRIANFINGELWGRPTTLPWGIIFPDAGPLPRHPSQLYEAALEGPLLFLVLWALYRFSSAKQRPGVLTGSFVLGYGVLRFLVEFIREPDQQLIAFAQATGLHMGQWLCVPMIVGGGVLIARGFNRPELRPRQLAP